MDYTPRVSYIVPSFNYGRYIATTIRSILDQTHHELEVIVVDDASDDDSVAVVRDLSDPRVRLLVNESNRGIVQTTNRAIEVASGEWLAFLDADDWIELRKTEVQLAAASEDPTLDIIGTHVMVVDAQGGPHPLKLAIEDAINTPHDFASLSTWIGSNYLCNSSTMVRRSTYRRLGPLMHGMVRTQDYEFWTRALRSGCRFGVVPEPLTAMRVHEGNFGTGDPVGSLLEMSYSMLRNLLPVADERMDLASFREMVSWVAAHPAFEQLPQSSAHRILGQFVTTRVDDDYVGYRDGSISSVARHQLELAGWHCLALLQPDSALAWYRQQAQNWREAATWSGQQAQNWRGAYETLAAAYGVQIARPEDVSDGTGTATDSAPAL